MKLTFLSESESNGLETSIVAIIVAINNQIVELTMSAPGHILNKIN